MHIGLFGGDKYQDIEDSRYPPSYTFLLNGWRIPRSYDNKYITIYPKKYLLFWNHNDVISIKLNLKKRNIEYFINNKSVGIIYKNIPIGDDIKYRLCILMSGEPQKIRLDSFEYIW